MKIVVAARCRNDKKHIERFLHGYSFADAIVISDGGSTDGSVELLKGNKKVVLHHFEEQVTVGDVTFNEDAPHMNFVIEKAKELDPDWLLFDDIDDIPNYLLRQNARYLFNEVIAEPQVNAYRLYMWGIDQWFPKMNENFHPDYHSLWGWKPRELDICADGEIIEGKKNHVSLVGMSNIYAKLAPPYCLLHFSWDEESVIEKQKRYDAMGIPFQHPFDMSIAGKPQPIPEWAVP